MFGKRIVRIMTASTLIMGILAFGAQAAQKQFIFNDIFKEAVGDKPSEWAFKETGGTVTVGNTAGTEPDTNALCLKDTDGNGVSGVTALRKFPAQKRSIAVEMRFKFDGQLGEFAVVVGGGTEEAVRVVSSKDGAFTASNGSRTERYQQSIAKLNNWNTVRMVINPNKGTADVRVNQELLHSLSIKGDCLDSGLDYVLLQTGEGKPTVYIDYLQVETGDNLTATVQPIEAPEVDDPLPRPVPGRINVNYNGEYIYFDYPPILFHDRVMLPLRRIFNLFDMQVEWIQETSTAVISDENYKIEVTENSTKANVNGIEKDLDASAIEQNGRMYVPVRFIAESIGAQVDWEEETQTVIIKK